MFSYIYMFEKEIPSREHWIIVEFVHIHLHLRAATEYLCKYHTIAEIFMCECTDTRMATSAVE